jgi:hypothetical protein
MIARFRIIHSLGLLFLFLTASSLMGQNGSGTIVGHIKDPSGAAINAANVSVVNADTKDTRTVKTNDSGDFTAPLLKPGHYDVTIAAKGFKAETQNGIFLNVDQIVRVDLSLTVGGSTEVVSVTADSIALDTDSASVGEVIEGKMIEDIPLNGRNFQDLLLTTPGAVNNGGGEQGTQRIVISGEGSSSIGVEGGRGASNGYTVDGSSIIDVGEQSPAFQPSIDDVAEFKLMTKTYSAAYGYNANQVAISTKAGTNVYHGTAFEFLRNTKTDATPWGNVPGLTVPLLHQNQFGYALGGPVSIPKVYNGHNKTFFFANYEGYRQSVAGSGSATIPTADQLAGTMSVADMGNVQPGGSRTQCGHTYNVGDPLPLFNPYDPNGCPLPLVNGVYTIPSGSVSNIGKLMQRPGLYFPASGPNIAGAPRGHDNYKFNAPSTQAFDQQNYRVDQNIGRNDALFFHAVYHNETRNSGAETPASAIEYIQPARFYSMTETHNFSTSFTNALRLGYVKATSGYHEALTISDADLNSLNFVSPYRLPIDGYPRLEFGGSAYGNQLVPSEVSYESPVNHLSDTWDGGDSAYKVWGRHTLNFGVDLRRTHYQTLNGGGLGYFGPNGQYSGDSVIDMLMGAPAGINTVQVGPLSSATIGLTGHLRLLTWAAYIQDDWKVTDKLTVNLGLRYEYTATPWEEQGMLAWPDFDAPGGAEYVANQKIVTAYAGVNPFGGGGLYVTPPNGKTLSGSQKNALAPRFGFAYRPFSNDKTVVRGGYGFYYDEYESNELTNSESMVGITSGVNTPGGTLPLSYPAPYQMNHLPAAGGPTGSAVLSEWSPNDPADSDTNPNSQLGFLVQIGGAFHQPYTENWTLSIERELPMHNSLEVDYVGAHYVHLFDRQDPNQPYPCNAATNCQMVGNPQSALPSTFNQDRVPYKNLGTLVNTLFNGWGNYNGLDVKVEHRAGNLTLISSYTWSKQMDVASSVAGLSGDAAGWAGPQNSHNNRGDYARGDFDVGGRLVASAVYALPVGKGKSVLANIPTAVDEVVGGWQLSAVAMFQGGLPFTITANDIGGSNGGYSQRADRLSAHPPASFHKMSTTLSDGSKCCWYSSSANIDDPSAQYSNPVAGLFGNSHRNDIRGPGLETGDVSLFKNFKIWERAKAEFRVDAFNAFNHKNPGGPSGGIGPNSGTIGLGSSQTDQRKLQGALRLSF